MRRTNFINSNKSVSKDYEAIGYTICEQCGRIEPPNSGHIHGTYLKLEGFFEGPGPLNDIPMPQARLHNE